jgi:adenylosuccinate lyase
MLIAMKSLEKGISKLILNESKINEDLDQNWAVVSEAIQNILRRISYPKPYEALKQLTRGNSKIDKNTIHSFIDTLDIELSLKERMKEITPFNYIGSKLTIDN